MTAVEWLYEKIWKEFNFSFSNNILEQAKEMEKQQIINAYHRGYANSISVPNKGYNPEKYYNETFKNR